MNPPKANYFGEFWTTVGSKLQWWRTRVLFTANSISLSCSFTCLLQLYWIYVYVYIWGRHPWMCAIESLGRTTLMGSLTTCREGSPVGVYVETIRETIPLGQWRGQSGKAANLSSTPSSILLWLCDYTSFAFYTNTTLGVCML